MLCFVNCEWEGWGHCDFVAGGHYDPYWHHMGGLLIRQAVVPGSIVVVSISEFKHLDVVSIMQY